MSRRVMLVMAITVAEGLIFVFRRSFQASEVAILAGSVLLGAVAVVIALAGIHHSNRKPAAIFAALAATTMLILLRMTGDYQKMVLGGVATMGVCSMALAFWRFLQVALKAGTKRSSAHR